MSEVIQPEDKYYIAVGSTYIDDRVKILNHADTFGIFDRRGDIKKIGEEVQGIYHDGTRFISDLELRINDVRPLLLSSSVKRENEILSVDLTNPTIFDINGRSVPKDTLYIGRSKFLRRGVCYEQITLINYGTEPYQVHLTLSFNADFKDIFEVRGIGRPRRGEVYEISHLSDTKLRIGYMGLDDVKRRAEVCFSQKPTGWERHDKVIFVITLEPRKPISLDYTLLFLIGDEEKENVGYTAAKLQLWKELKENHKNMVQILTSGEKLNLWIERSRSDLLSLLADTPYGKYPYAGVPWYNTAFGRDGIITALQTLWMAPDIAKDVLRFLANTQAKEIDPYRDAEPGKIVHEVRGGEMAQLGEIPFKRYYGSVDATPLFIVLAGAYYRRTADLDTIKSVWENIEAAICWIDKYGDINGDGFVEYRHKSENGLTNQGWKDSFDSISDEDGNLAAPPIALCEVQGYVYEAKIQAAMLSEALGLTERAAVLKAQAEDLKQRFNNAFWDEALQCYVLALDGNGKPCRVRSSNAGHCLFSGIADRDKAEKVAAVLLSEEMYSGWGIRTLGKKEKRYNPMSYHNGSVWPHDVAMIAKGFARYGFRRQTAKLMATLHDASLFIEAQRLPELYCGFHRRPGEGPTNYPVACSPQAWSVGAVFMLLEACLSIEIIAEEKKVYFKNPVMPEGIETIEVKNLRLGDATVDFELHHDSRTLRLEIDACPPGWSILFTEP